MGALTSPNFTFYVSFIDWFKEVTLSKLAQITVYHNVTVS